VDSSTSRRIFFWGCSRGDHITANVLWARSIRSDILAATRSESFFERAVCSRCGRQYAFCDQFHYRKHLWARLFFCHNPWNILHLLLTVYSKFWRCTDHVLLARLQLNRFDHFSSCYSSPLLSDSPRWPRVDPTEANPCVLGRRSLVVAPGIGSGDSVCTEVLPSASVVTRIENRNDFNAFTDMEQIAAPSEVAATIAALTVRLDYVVYPHALF
jgi:hypothetical protein